MTHRLYNPNDNLTGRDGGPYADVEEAKFLEARRARVEGREPDFDHPPVPAGIPLVTGPQQMTTASVNNLPSQNSRFGLNVVESVEEVSKSEENERSLLKSWGEVPSTDEEAAKAGGVELEEDNGPEEPSTDSPQGQTTSTTLDRQDRLNFGEPTSENENGEQ